MEFCLDDRGRIVQKFPFTHRTVSPSVARISTSSSSQATTSWTNSMDSLLDRNNIIDGGDDDDSPLASGGCVSIAGTNSSIAKGGVPVPFPWRLHDMLDAMEKQGKDDIVTWQPHGLAFLVKDPKAFVEQIMPHYFSQSKYASFQRQLNLYGFSRLGHGRDKGAYYHECFIKGDRDKVRNMIRKKVKGTMVRKSFGPEEEPNFYDSQWNSLQQRTRPAKVSPDTELNRTGTSERSSSPFATDSGSTSTSSSAPPFGHIQKQQQLLQNNTRSWDDTATQVPVPILHGFTTHIDPRRTLEVPTSLTTTRKQQQQQQQQPSPKQPQLSQMLILEGVVHATTCPLSRLAAVAGQFDDAVGSDAD